MARFVDTTTNTLPRPSQPTRVEHAARSLLPDAGWIVPPLLIWLCSRVALLIFSMTSLHLHPKLWTDHQLLAFATLFRPLDGFCRWDCSFFDRIARNGYLRAQDTNFFPLYPLLTRWLHQLTGLHIDLALLAVSNLAGLAALLVIARIFARLSGPEDTHWALLLFAAYPFAFFQATAYPESLMILCSAVAILLALQGHHWSAGIALGVGVLARHLTMFAGAGLLAAQIRQRGLRPRRLLLHPAILGLVIPWLFLGGYCLYQARTFGDPLAFWHARAGWGPRAWWGIAQLLTTSERDIDTRIMLAYVPFALLPTLGAIALATRRRWAELAAFALVLFGVLWATGIWGLGRYSASCWPAFLPLGVWAARHPIARYAVLGVLIVAQGVFFYLFVHQYPIL